MHRLFRLQTITMLTLSRQIFLISPSSWLASTTKNWLIGPLIIQDGKKLFLDFFSEIVFAILTLKFPISACRQLYKIGTETDRNVWIHSPLSKISKTDLKQCLQILWWIQSKIFSWIESSLDVRNEKKSQGVNFTPCYKTWSFYILKSWNKVLHRWIMRLGNHNSYRYNNY